MEGNMHNRAQFRLLSLDPPRQRNPLPAYSATLFIMGGVISLCLCIYITISRFYFSSQIASDNMLRSDWYHVLVVPLTLPVTVVAVYFHWLSMKLFKHA